MSMLKCKRDGTEWDGQRLCFCPECLFTVMKATPNYFYTGQDTSKPPEEIVRETLRTGITAWDTIDQRYLVVGERGGKIVWVLPITHDMLERYKQLTREANEPE